MDYLLLLPHCIPELQLDWVWLIDVCIARAPDPCRVQRKAVGVTLISSAQKQLHFVLSLIPTAPRLILELGFLFPRSSASGKVWF